MNLFSDENRRNPFPLYDQLRLASPVLRVPPPMDAWMILDYEGVKWVLNDHDTFSSRVPAPPWFIFFDPPQHTKLRALISRAFTPRMIAGLEARIRALSHQLLDAVAGRGEMDLVADYATPLPMQVIAGMIGVPASDWPLYRHWSEVILRISYSRSGGEEAAQVLRDFAAVTAEMQTYLAEQIRERRATPQDDLLSGLIHAEVDGEHLSQREILSFFQLLLVGGQETTTNLISNAVVCLLDNPGQLARLRAAPGLLVPAIEEVLRYRSPVQWMLRRRGGKWNWADKGLAPASYFWW